MDILIPLTIAVIVIVISIKRFKPRLWNQIVSKFKK